MQSHEIPKYETEDEYNKYMQDLQRQKEIQNRKFYVLLIFSLVLISVSLPFFTPYFKDINDGAFSVASVVMLITAVFLSFYQYLNYGFTFYKIPKKYEYDLKSESSRNIDERIASIEASLSRTREKLDSVPVNQLAVNTYTEQEYILSYFLKTIQRLKDEVVALNRRSHINLIIGGSITTLGLIVFIIFMTWSSEFKNADIFAFLSHYIPRLSLVALIEVFAYFFLTLYRSNLNDIKYYQNEITNLECRKIGLIHYRESTKDKNSLKIFEYFNNTDRNHVLKKGETTVEIEREKALNFQNENFSKKLLDIINISKFINPNQEKQPGKSANKGQSAE